MNLILNDIYFTINNWKKLKPDSSWHVAGVNVFNVCIRRQQHVHLALGKIIIYLSVSSSTTVLLCVSSHCLSEMVLEFCIWPYGVNFWQFYPKWHDCWPGHCIMDELQPLISPWATSSFSSSSCLSFVLLLLFPLCVAKCIIQLERVKGTERRWESDSEWVGESQNF